ncbi:MnhB domain-containing protein [Wukongibacter baidiensis]|uniref:MnhB domain-containing protein n=1 Tax=Wukongibacter baidiensis TaxID=1723361 RepID=UPI003D7F81F9
MKNSPILICACRVLYPFMLLFGFYIIINGHNSPGGGFQGGAILATAILITFFIDPGKITNLNYLIKLEKLSFIGILIVSSISLFTKGVLYTNFIVSNNINLKSIFLVLLNLFIGIKVALGLVSIFSTFIDEGRS